MSLAELQASLEAISRARRGPHPDPERLLAYHLGEIDDEAAAEEIEEHVALCSDCARHLLDMERFLAGDDPAADVAPRRSRPGTDAAPADGGRIVPLPERAREAGDGQGPDRFYATLGFARAAALALLVVSAGLAAWVLFGSGGARPGVDATLANLPIVDLRPQAARGPGERDVARLTGDAAGAVLVFPLAAAGEAERYELVVEKAEGGEVFRRALTRTPDGLLTLVVRRDRLAAGVYRLSILDAGAGAGVPPRASFELEWRLD